MKYLIILFLLVGCVMPESYLKQTELQEVPGMHIDYQGNTVWLTYDDSTARNMGYSKAKYEMKKYKKEYFPWRVTTYDSTGALLNSESMPTISITKYRGVTRLKYIVKYFDENKKPFAPKYIDCAKQKWKYHKDGTWTIKHYGADLKPRCGDKGFIIHQKYDTIPMQLEDTVIESYMLKNLKRLDCKRNELELNNY